MHKFRHIKNMLAISYDINIAVLNTKKIIGYFLNDAPHEWSNSRTNTSSVYSHWTSEEFNNNNVPSNKYGGFYARQWMYFLDN